MADIDDALRADNAPGEPSPRLAASVMEAVHLEKEAPPRSGDRRVALAAGALSLLALLGLVLLAILTKTVNGPVEIVSTTDPGDVETVLEWVATSGGRLLVATLGLVAAILLVRRAERSV